MQTGERGGGAALALTPTLSHCDGRGRADVEDGRPTGPPSRRAPIGFLTLPPFDPGVLVTVAEPRRSPSLQPFSLRRHPRGGSRAFRRRPGPCVVALSAEAPLPTNTDKGRFRRSPHFPPFLVFAPFRGTSPSPVTDGRGVGVRARAADHHTHSRHTSPGEPLPTESPGTRETRDDEGDRRAAAILPPLIGEERNGNSLPRRAT
jgi:hypothetical protein